VILTDFKRIEAPGYQPLSTSEAIPQMLKFLGLTLPNQAQAVSATVADGKSTRKSVLWVDDNPSNNFYERRSLQQHGITFTLSTSTDDALGKLIRNHFDAIISDMGRPPDTLAGYTLLEWARKINVTVPFILYCPTRPEFVVESKRRGALGQTSSLDELSTLLKAALNLR
jgi:DNA-binding NtrC family response regulator